VHLRGHINILKRLLIHIGGFNRGLLMLQLIGVGTPRGLEGREMVLLRRVSGRIYLTRHARALKRVALAPSGRSRASRVLELASSAAEKSLTTTWNRGPSWEFVLAAVPMIVPTTRQNSASRANASQLA
jgi:hypothetical protein